MARALQDWIKAYMAYTSPQEAPDQFHFWTAVATIAGALRRKVCFDQRPFYVWHPNFYIVFVAPPAVSTKSTTMNLGMSLLREVDGVRFGPQSITWQSLITDMSAAAEMILMPDGNYHSMSCLTFAASELGTLLNPNDRDMLTVLTDLWDGQDGSFKKATKTSGRDEIVNPWINIIAATTPSWIADNMPRSVIGGGFTSRCVFVFADAKRHFVAYPKFEIDIAKLDELREALIHDLEMISMLKGTYELCPDARKFGEKWYKEHHSKPNEHLNGDSQFAGYLGRKQAHVHKLAIVLAAAQSDELLISRQHLEAAIKITSGLEAAMPAVFREINADPAQSKAERLVEYIRAKGAMPKGTVYSLFFKQMTMKEFNEALDAAVAANLLTVENRSGVAYLRGT